jgi:hypothetical protein
MRLWSLHPRYLDQKGLVAVWREGLLALAVLKGKTKGYKYHPQLIRFRSGKAPIECMKCYLWHIYQESVVRGYHFDLKKIGKIKNVPSLKVTAGQLSYELEHLKGKLRTRDPSMYRKLRNIASPNPHPLLKVVSGKIEEWERVE